MNRPGAAVALLLGLTGCDYLYHQRTVYAIEGATLIDGGVLPPISPSVVVVVDGKITAMGRPSEVTIPSQAERINASGRFVIPLSFSQPLMVGGPGDLYVCDVNPVRMPAYKKYLYGRLENGRWWGPEELLMQKRPQQKARPMSK